VVTGGDVIGTHLPCSRVSVSLQDVVAGVVVAGVVEADVVVAGVVVAGVVLDDIGTQEPPLKTSEDLQTRAVVVVVPPVTGLLVVDVVEVIELEVPGWQSKTML